MCERSALLIETFLIAKRAHPRLRYEEAALVAALREVGVLTLGELMALDAARRQALAHAVEIRIP